MSQFELRSFTHHCVKTIVAIDISELFHEKLSPLSLNHNNFHVTQCIENETPPPYFPITATGEVHDSLCVLLVCAKRVQLFT